MTKSNTPGEVGFVAIGRNEGERLIRCLDSMLQGDASGRTRAVIYVDSNSSDASVSVARRKGITVVELDMSQPFSAARARNEGFQALMRHHPQTRYVQFADGDCEIVSGWTDRAVAELESDTTLAAVAGRRRERHPRASTYNRLCDLEWDTPVGDAKACGGDVMMVADALQQVGGYNPAVIAGEEPELCVRLRAAGWKIRRIDAEMTLHDAAMMKFKQWWQRMKRAGHAYAQGAAMHGHPPERHWVRQVRSICFWAGFAPAIILLAAIPTQGLSLLGLLGYPLLVTRAMKYYLGRGFSRSDARLAATFDVMAKFPQLVGVLTYHMNHLRSRDAALIEYKGAPS